MPSAYRSPFRFFSPDSIWNRSLSADAQIDPGSAGLMGGFEAEVGRERQAGEGPGINTIAYSVPIYTVPADQPTVKVALATTSAAPALRSAWDSVPLPPGAEPAAGSDGVLVVWQPSPDRLSEFWRLAHGAGGWHASWDGAMQHVSSNPAVHGPEAWLGAKPWWNPQPLRCRSPGG